jgi:hypothetical protein
MTYSIFGSLEGEESRGEERRGEGNDYPFPLFGFF